MLKKIVQKKKIISLLSTLLMTMQLEICGKGRFGLQLYFWGYFFFIEILLILKSKVELVLKSRFLTSNNLLLPFNYRCLQASQSISTHDLFSTFFFLFCENSSIFISTFITSIKKMEGDDGRGNGDKLWQLFMVEVILANR